jgi:hypothetical protein
MTLMEERALAFDEVVREMLNKDLCEIHNQETFKAIDDYKKVLLETSRKINTIFRNQNIEARNIDSQLLESVFYLLVDKQITLYYGAEDIFYKYFYEQDSYYVRFHDVQKVVGVGADIYEAILCSVLYGTPEKLRLSIYAVIDKTPKDELQKAYNKFRELEEKYYKIKKVITEISHRIVGEEYSNDAKELLNENAERISKLLLENVKYRELTTQINLQKLDEQRQPSNKRKHGDEVGIDNVNSNQITLVNDPEIFLYGRIPPPSPLQ